MNIGRFFLLVSGVLFTSSLAVVPAFAGWFGGDDNAGKSGLDLNRGYDINTVTTVTGRAISAPHRIDGEHVGIDVRTAQETVSVCVGPAFFWESKGIAVAVNDEMTAKGSMAQGQDGRKYLIAQKLTDKNTGASVELRSDNGTPAWSGRNMGSGGRSDGGMRNRGMSRGGMMRGGGMRR